MFKKCGKFLYNLTFHQLNILISTTLQKHIKGDSMAFLINEDVIESLPIVLIGGLYLVFGHSKASIFSLAD